MLYYYAKHIGLGIDLVLPILPPKRPTPMNWLSWLNYTDDLSFPHALPKRYGHVFVSWNVVGLQRLMSGHARGGVAIVDRCAEPELVKRGTLDHHLIWAQADNKWFSVDWVTYKWFSHLYTSDLVTHYEPLFSFDFQCLQISRSNQGRPITLNIRVIKVIAFSLIHIWEFLR